jgi:hypothetical protein
MNLTFFKLQKQIIPSMTAMKTIKIITALVDVAKIKRGEIVVVEVDVLGGYTGIVAVRLRKSLSFDILS